MSAFSYYMGDEKGCKEQWDQFFLLLGSFQERKPNTNKNYSLPELVSFRISQWDNPTYHRGYITRLRYHTSYSLSLSCSSIGNTWHALQNHVVKSFFYLLVATQYKTLVVLSQYL